MRGEDARLTVRDLWTAPDDLATTEAVLAELSHLADAVLAAALRHAEASAAGHRDKPTWTGAGKRPFAPRFCVLGMGKLGGEELNYSSDVDLIYVLEDPPGPLLPQSIGDGATPIEYYTRVAREFGRLVGETTQEGFLYRIDLDLRRKGSRARWSCRAGCSNTTTTRGRPRGRRPPS